MTWGGGRRCLRGYDPTTVDNRVVHYIVRVPRGWRPSDDRSECEADCRQKALPHQRRAARVRRTPRFPSSAAFLVLRTLPPGPARSRRPALRNTKARRSLLFSTIYAPTAAHLAPDPRPVFFSRDDLCPNRIAAAHSRRGPDPRPGSPQSSPQLTRVGVR